MSRRRITLQLTALLDLMLIIVFAQYLEVKTAMVRDITASAAAKESAEQTERSREGEVEELRRRNREIAVERDAAERRNVELQRQETALSEEYRLAIEQRDVVGRLASELFRIPSNVLEKALQPGSEKTLTDAEVQGLRKTVQALAENRAGAVTRHLLTYAELRKRSDVWDVTLDEAGWATMNTGERSHKFRAEDPAVFAREMFDSYKASPQPKGLVIMLLSWGDTPAKWREAAVKGIREAADRMRDDSAGRSRFEYAVLGFRP